MDPVFLLSLPRSGSTLLQRILATHEEITTVSEPWLLLHQLYAFRKRGMWAEYHHGWSVDALTAFCEALPEGQETYLNELRGFVQRLYAAAAKRPCQYFLDKTPPYCLVAPELLRLFPEAKTVFLWRNPLAVAGSMITSWGAGRWNVFQWEPELRLGLVNLIDAYTPARDRAHALRYEDLVSNPAVECERLFQYLALSFSSDSLERFVGVQFEGMGDQVGSKKYDKVSTTPLDGWLAAFANPLRRRWARDYLRWIGPERLAVMGYELDQLEHQLDTAPRRFERLASDVAIRGIRAIVDSDALVRALRPLVVRSRMDPKALLQRIRQP